MFMKPETITYALPEQIGDYELFVQRKKEFDCFIEDWYRFLINNMAVNRVIAAYTRIRIRRLLVLYYA